MEDNKKRKRPLITPTQNRNLRTGKPIPKIPSINNVTSNVKREEKVPNSLEKLFTDKEEAVIREDVPINNQEEITLEKYNKPTIVPLDQWKQTFRKTDSIELASLVQYSSLSHNALLRITGSYSTKMMSNLKINHKEMSGIESRATKVFYNQELDIRKAIKTNLLSYIPYCFNYISSIEEDTTKQVHVDNLLVLNEKLFFSLYMHNNEVIETECIPLTKENKVTGDFRIKDTRNSLKIFVTEEQNNAEMFNTISQQMKQNFILIELNRNENNMTIQLYNNDGVIPFSVDNLRRLNEGKITKLKDKSEYEDVKAKYTREK